MKSKKIFTRLSLALFLTFFSAFLYKCETDDEMFESQLTITEQVKRQTQVIPFEKLPLKMMESVNLLEKAGKSNNRDINDLLTIDYGKIIQVIDADSNEKLSIKFSLPNQPANILYNLILGTNSDGSEVEPFVLKYTINNLDEVYTNGYHDFSKMKGNVSKYQLHTFLAWVDGASSRTENDEEPTPCVDYDVDGNNGSGGNDTGGGNNNSGGNGSTGGGGGGSTGGDSTEGGNHNDGNDYGGNGSGHDSSSGSGGGEFENTDDTVDCNIAIFSNGETGELFGISWSCSDGQSGNQYWGRTQSNENDDEDCPGDGDIGINFNWPHTNCASFEYSNRDGIKGAHTIGVTNLFTASITRPTGTTFVATSITYPNLFFTMPSHWTNGLSANLTAKAVDKSIDKTKSWFRQNPTASDFQLQLTWFNFMKVEMAVYGGTVHKTALFPVRSPAPYMTSWFATNCL